MKIFLYTPSGLLTKGRNMSEISALIVKVLYCNVVQSFLFTGILTISLRT